MTTEPRESTLAFEATSVTRRFGEVAALTDVNLRVPDGAFLLLVGANGAGKTTLLSLFLDFIHPTTGSLRVFGIDPTRDGGRVRAAIGYVPEAGTWPWPEQTIQQFLAYQSVYRSTWDAKYAAHLTRILDLRLDRSIGAASKGEFRRAQLVAALAHQPPALLLDEPTDGLDPLVRARFKEVLAAHLSDHPCTVITSSHLVHEAELFADRLAIMHGGRVTDSVSQDEIRRDIRRIRFRPPTPEWEPPVLPRTRRLRHESRGGEEQWTVWGPYDQVVETLRDAGAAISHVGVLTLEEAAVALLTIAEPDETAHEDTLVTSR